MREGGVGGLVAGGRLIFHLIRRPQVGVSELTVLSEEASSNMLDIDFVRQNKYF